MLNQQKCLFAVLTMIIFVSPLTDAEENSRGTPGGIIFNEDNTHFFSSSSQAASKKGLISYIDTNYLRQANVKALVFCPAAAKASYNSKVFSPAWKDVIFHADGSAEYHGKKLPNRQAKAYMRMKKLSDEGINPYQVWIAHCRSKNVAPWISLRMNDCHDSTLKDSVLQSRFLKKHPEYRIATYRGAPSDWGLDYGRKEVRNYIFSMFTELMELYDADGFELDWMRHGRVFRRGEEVKNRKLLTELLYEIRKKANEMEKIRGHKIEISVRVPATPEDAYALGYDVEEWAKRGLINQVVPATFYQSAYEGYPIRTWRKFVGEKVRIAPSIEAHFRSYKNGPAIGSDFTLDNALAAYYYWLGADRIYFFNHFGHQWQKAGSIAVVNAAPRRHMLMFNDFPVTGKRLVQVLPRTLKNRQWADFRLDIGPLPAAKRKRMLIIGSKSPFPKGRFAFVVMNGFFLKRNAEMSARRMSKQIKGIAVFDIIPKHALQSEGNVISIQNLSKNMITIDHLEIYLP